MLDAHDHDHDHGHCQEKTLRRVEKACERKGLRMTTPRRQVLNALLDDHVPLTAYELIDKIALSNKRPSPVSVYRALDFLIENGIVHRIESRNAFVVCSHDHKAEGSNAVFLLCETCGVAVEAETGDLTAKIAAIAAETGFQVNSAVLELRGRCRNCLEQEATDAAKAQ